MSKRGHCHHCMDECQGNRSVGHVNQNVSVQWADGECIACDEATHMASRIEELIAEYQQSTTGESSGLVGLEIALMILKRIDCQALIVLMSIQVLVGTSLVWNSLGEATL